MVDVMKNLTDFLNVAPHRILAGRTHICLYTAILVLCQQHGGFSIIEVSRKKLMHLSQIKSNATYHKCMTELVSGGYIRYIPSYHPVLGSRVEIL